MCDESRPHGVGSTENHCAWLGENSIQAATNLSVSTIDSNSDYRGGVSNTIIWSDSPSTGAITYRVRRGPTNNPNDSTVIFSNIQAGVESYKDSTATPDQEYYYFVEVTDGNSRVVSDGAYIKTSTDYHYKEAAGKNYRSADANLFAYDPATDSFM